MRPILGTILTLALASGASVALAQSYQPPPTYQQWGDDREGGHRYAYGDPNSPEGYVEEEYYRRALPPAPPPPPAYDYGYSQGGYAYSPPPQYEYAQAPCRTCNGAPVGGYEVPTYGYASQNYGWPGAACGCGAGELTYGYMGSGYHGGVGGPASYGYSGGYGGGYMYQGGGGHARSWSSSSASARASAYSSSSTSVRVR